MTSSAADKGPPILFIDVNLGGDKGMQRLIIYSADDPKRVAAKFSTNHNISVGKQSKLEQMLIRKLKECSEKSILNPDLSTSP